MEVSKLWIEMDDTSTNTVSTEYLGFAPSFFGLKNQLEVVGVIIREVWV